MKIDTPEKDMHDSTLNDHNHPVFSGNVYVFTAFDVGFDMDFKGIKQFKEVRTEHVHVSKFFKHYHLPLEITIADSCETSRCVSSKIHQFGAISMTYKIPIFFVYNFAFA